MYVQIPLFALLENVVFAKKNILHGKDMCSPNYEWLTSSRHLRYLQYVTNYELPIDYLLVDH